VAGARVVDVVHHRGQRSALAAARRAGDEDEASLEVGELGEDRRQVQLFDPLHPPRNHAKREADRAALLEDVAAEAPEPLDPVRDVDLLQLVELLPLCGRHHRRRHRHGVLVRHVAVLAGGHQRAVDAHHRITADFHVQVGRPGVDGDLQQVVDVHAPISLWPP
jgi:hypothetical protein